jgi:hypoxanthine phosphoribosyltransferase
MLNQPPMLWYNQKKFEILIPKEKIESVVEELAAKINKDYSGKKPVFLLVLKGSIFFATDLLRKITLDCELETVSAKSYGPYMKSTGEVNLMLTKLDITGKDVIIVEDIIDSGLTINKLVEKLKFFNPLSVEVVSLLSKPEMRKVNVNVKYIGMEIPARFVIGYGLDYSEHGRNLPSIYALEEK